MKTDSLGELPASSSDAALTPSETNPKVASEFRWSILAWVAILVLLWASGLVMFLPGAQGLELIARLLAMIIFCSLVSLQGYLPVLLLLGFFASERSRAQESARIELKHHGWDRFLPEANEWYRTVFDSRRYPIPVTLAVATFVAGWVYVYIHAGPDFLYDMTSTGELSQLLVAAGSGPPVSYGFIGSYVFAIWFLFKRYVGGDLGPAAYLHVSIRTWLVTILALVATVVMTGTPFPATTAEIRALSALAFLGGLTPWLLLSVVAGALTGAVRSLFKRETEEVSLSALQGMNPWKAARLVEEGVDNVQNLAMEDPTRLLVVTREGGLRILDWVDQAILYNATSDTVRRALKDAGIRTAVDLYLVLRQLDLVEQVARPSGLRRFLIKESQEALFGIEPAVLRNVAVSIVDHPNFEKIYHMRAQALKVAITLFEDRAVATDSARARTSGRRS